MGEIVLARCLVTNQNDWIPVVLDADLEQLSVELGTLQERQSKERRLKDRAIDKNPEASLRRTIASKRAEYAVHQHYGRIARVTQPGEFHDWPDVGQCNVRFVGDPNDGLMIQDRDQGDLVTILCASKDITLQDKTVWLVGWGLTDLLRRTSYKINQGRDVPAFGIIGNMQPHEQCCFPSTMLNPMITLSKEFVNTPYINKKK
jgi:hypothetical protein